MVMKYLIYNDILGSIKYTVSNKIPSKITCLIIDKFFVK